VIDQINFEPSAQTGHPLTNWTLPMYQSGRPKEAEASTKSGSIKVDYMSSAEWCKAIRRRRRHEVTVFSKAQPLTPAERKALRM
jgi:hypothetical protein